MYYLITMIKQKNKLLLLLNFSRVQGEKKESKSKLKYDPKQQNWKKKGWRDGGI